MILMQFYIKWMLASQSLSGYRSNSLIAHCITHLHYPVELKWTPADHSLNQLSFKFKVLCCFRSLRNAL